MTDSNTNVTQTSNMHNTAKATHIVQGEHIVPLRSIAVVIPCWSERLKLDVQLPPVLMSDAQDVCTPDHTTQHCQAPPWAATNLNRMYDTVTHIHTDSSTTSSTRSSNEISRNGNMFSLVMSPFSPLITTRSGLD